MRPPSSQLGGVSLPWLLDVLLLIVTSHVIGSLCLYDSSPPYERSQIITAVESVDLQPIPAERVWEARHRSSMLY